MVSDLARGERLREERERRALSQTAFAELAGSSKRAQIRYEQGDAPDADYFSALAATGIDVLYILTGARHPAAAPPAPALSPEQRALLDNYAACAPEDRAAVRRFAAAAAQPLSAPRKPASQSVAQTFHGNVGHASGGDMTVIHKGKKR